MTEARKGTKGSATAAGVHLKLSKEQVAFARTLQRSIKVEGGGRNEVRARLITACLFVVTDMTNEALENGEDWEGGGIPLQAYYKDLMADMLHFEDQSGVDGLDAQEIASTHFQQESRHLTA